MSETFKFKEIVDEQSPISQRKQFIQHMAEITKKSENAVRCWRSGRQVPDDLTQQIIADELGLPVEGLFPSRS